MAEEMHYATKSVDVLVLDAPEGFGEFADSSMVTLEPKAQKLEDALGKIDLVQLIQGVIDDARLEVKVVVRHTPDTY